MSKFIIKSMGCKSNQFEGQIITEKLINKGFEQVSDIKEADFYILNSCTVTHKSDKEVLYILRNAKHTNKQIKTILTGCLAQVDKDELQKEKYIDYIYGNDDKFQIGELLQQNNHVAVSDIMALNKFNPQILVDSSKTRVSLKIQDGCDYRCSYCIIPFARGKSRSANLDFITEQINHYSKLGFKEVVLTGIHIGQWGIEFDKTFLDLVKAIENETDIPRYRVGSLNPTEINPELLKFLQNSNRFCPHFHLSLQSACNRTLKSMNRFYTVTEYLDQIEYIYDNFNHPYMGSDIIAGFVGETEDDFNITIENLKSSKLSKIHTFPYSIRHNTIAEKMVGHLSDKTKEYRAKIIKEISKEKLNTFLNSNIGTIQEVLIEKHNDKHINKLKGVSKNYINVLLDKNYTEKEMNNMHNTIQKVKLTRIDGEKMYGTIE